MIAFPSPLHPAVVHFPIAFLMAGAATALVTAFFRRWHLPWLVALLLVLGAAGSVVAVGTGEEEEEMAEASSAAAERILDEHEEWGKLTRNLALAAAVFALAAAFAAKTRMAGLGLSVVTALLALSGAYAVAQTGHYGGELVYRHGVGINTAGAEESPEAAADLPQQSSEGERGERDDDD